MIEPMRQRSATGATAAPRRRRCWRSPASSLSMALVAVGNGLMFAYIPVGSAPPASADLGGLDPHRPVGRRHRRLPADRAAGAPGRPCTRLHGAVGADRAVQRRRRRRLVSVPVDRRARALRLRHLRLFIVAQSWLNDAVGNAHPRPGHGDLLCRLCRRARRRLRLCCASSISQRPRRRWSASSSPRCRSCRSA